MQGTWTKLYHNFFEETKSELSDLLKIKLRNTSYETKDEIVAQFGVEVSKLFDQLSHDTSSLVSKKSWFKTRLIEEYKHNQFRYQEGFQIDGFLEFNPPDIQKEFNRNYDHADEQTREGKYFDRTSALSSGYKIITKLLAAHDAYLNFFENKLEWKDQLLKIIAIEKKLVDINHFNKLKPIEVFYFFRQLTQANSSNRKSFLSEQQVYDLTNMIFQNQPATAPV